MIKERTRSSFIVECAASSRQGSSGDILEMDNCEASRIAWSWLLQDYTCCCLYVAISRLPVPWQRWQISPRIMYIMRTRYLRNNQCSQYPFNSFIHTYIAVKSSSRSTPNSASSSINTSISNPTIPWCTNTSKAKTTQVSSTKSSRDSSYRSYYVCYERWKVSEKEGGRI